MSWYLWIHLSRWVSTLPSLKLQPRERSSPAVSLFSRLRNKRVLGECQRHWSFGLHWLGFAPELTWGDESYASWHQSYDFTVRGQNVSFCHMLAHMCFGEFLSISFFTLVKQAAASCCTSWGVMKSVRKASIQYTVLIHPKDNLSFLKLVPSPLPTLSHLLNVIFFKKK